jgi:hypothetical protein
VRYRKRLEPRKGRHACNSLENEILLLKRRKMCLSLNKEVNSKNMVVLSSVTDFLWTCYSVASRYSRSFALRCVVSILAPFTSQLR